MSYSDNDSNKQSSVDFFGLVFYRSLNIASQRNEHTATQQPYRKAYKKKRQAK